MATEPSDRLAVLVARCLEAMEAEGDAAIDRLAREQPDLAHELRRQIESLRRFGMLAPADEAVPPAIPERLGEFRLRARLGGGGMGVVYLAEQPSLGREVALKLVRPEQLFFAGARERFLREVAIIAKLQHPGIVPIHTVGEENGVPYYAMERVVGCTLAEVVQDLASRRPETLSGADLRAATARRSKQPDGGAGVASSESWVDACVRVVAQVADALSHAHQRGVVHRDVKPSNVMVTPEGRVMLLDFGLASSEEASRITKTGSQPGSLPYMAPEQIRGDAAAIDARTDVYQLGVTLFELLSLRLPYGADSSEETRQLILGGATPPLRMLNRRVPWDVETVCLTAMERERARRYASAAAFHADLQNLLARRPIVARRPGPMLRARRFAQRHPAITVGAALGLLIVVGGPLAYAKFERDARLELQAEQGRTKAQRVRAEAQTARAEAHFRRVIDAVDRLLEPLLDRTADEIPEMESVRREVLERALAVYGGFDAEEAADPALREDVAKALVRDGEIHSALRRHDRAVASLQRGVAVLESLLAERPADPALRFELGRALQQLASTAIPQVEEASAEPLLRRAIAAFESIAADAAPARKARLAAAEARAKLASNLSAQLRITEAEQEARAAIVAATAARAAAPDDPVAIELVARGQRALGDVLAFIPGGVRRDEGVAAYEAAAASYAEVIERGGGTRRPLYARAQVLFRLGRAKDTLGRRDEAVEHALEALRLFEELHARYPEVHVYAHEVGNLRSELGYFRLAQGRSEEARAQLERAVPLLREAARRDATQVMRPVVLAIALARLGEAELECGDAVASIAAYDEAIEQGSREFESKPAWIADSVAGWRFDRIESQVAAGELDEAADAIDELVDEEQSGFGVRSRSVLLLARCAKRAASLDELPEEERRRRAESFDEESLARLEQAIARGFRPTSAWLADPALDRLRDRLAALGY